ncbi:MAG: adenosine deaminase [Pseudomonadota bacterium]|nr:adenosine deaminase [Pseudomonadota bacterium]
MPVLPELVRSAPKAELHVHIEGTLEPELAFALAARNAVDLGWSDAAALRQAYAFGDLQSFLDLYYACTRVLCTAADFRDLMLAYLARAAADGVVYAEIFFDPQVHAERGVALGTVLDGLCAGLELGRSVHGVEGTLILCFLRHLSEAEAFATLAEARPHLDRIAGFGLDSGERGNPPARFERVFAACRALGKPVVAHAGEEGPAEYVSDALDRLGALRIDHGVRAIDDPLLVQRLVRHGIPLTVCPLSNVRLQVTPELHRNPLQALLDAGVAVTLNSDDPAYFGGYLNANLEAVHQAFDWPLATWQQVLGNAFRASFRPAHWQQARLEHLARHFARA